MTPNGMNPVLLKPGDSVSFKDPIGGFDERAR